MNKFFVLLMVALPWSFLPAAVLAAPSPPVIELTTSGLTATAAWTPVPGATGYTLYYAPSPYTGEETIGAIEVGSQTSYSAELWTGAAFYVAVKAYDGQGYSDYSNLAQFSIQPPLRAAASAAELEAYLKRGLAQQGVTWEDYNYLGYFFDIAGAPVAATSGGDRSYSGTNLQVVGVDEADRVKTDGRFMYVAVRPDTTTYPSPGMPVYAPWNSQLIRVMRLDTTPPGAAEIARVELEPDANLQNEMSPLLDLYLVKDDQPGGRDILVALGTTQDRYYPWRLDWFDPMSWQKLQTVVNLIDVTVPSTPQVAKTFLYDGRLVSSRRVGSLLHLVLRHTPSLPPGYINYPQNEAERAQNQLLLDGATLNDLLPRYRINGVDRGMLASVASSYLPNINPESATADLITLVTLDLAAPDRAPIAVTIAGPTETLYMSTEALYLATTSSNYQPFTIDGAMVFYESSMTTDIHKFALTATGPEFRGSGTVAGHLGWEQDKKSFRMGEVGDALGVVTSVGEDWGGTATTKLTLLGENLASVGALTEIAHLPNDRRPEPLGKPGERLYAARFLGDRLYLVTFRVTDPLYILDLADPADPRIAGELEISGYSDYLHPVGENLLLGIGKDAVPDLNAPPEGRGAWYQGLKLSLFDISDAAAPREIESIVIGRRGTHSEVLTDHHALTYFQTSAGSARLAIPVELHESTYRWGLELTEPWYSYDWTHTGLYLFDINGIDTVTPGLNLTGRMIVDEIEYYSPKEDRAVIIDDSVHYLHDDGVLSGIWSAPWAAPEQAVGPQ